MAGKKYGRTWRKRRGKIKQEQQEALEIANYKFKNLMKWMVSEGFANKSYSFKLHDFAGTGRGLMCKKNIDAGRDLIQVPENLIITTQTVFNSYIGDILKCCGAKTCSPMQVLCVFIMCEWCRGERSFWWPYLQVLPTTYNTPVHWDDALVERCPEVLREKARQQRAQVRAMYEASVPVLDAVETTGHLASAGGLTEERFRWAWSTVNTRCVYWKQDARHVERLNHEVDHYALVPLLDMLNHSADARVEAGFDYTTTNFKICTLVPYKKYQQVFINYGPHDNSKLLIEYGFVLPRNPNNVITWSAVELIDTVKMILSPMNSDQFNKSVDILEQSSLTEGVLCSMEGLSWSLLTGLKILALEAKQLFRWRECLEEEYLSSCHKARTHQLAQQLLGKKEKQFLFPQMIRAQESTEIDFAIALLCEMYTDIIAHCQTTLG